MTRILIFEDDPMMRKELGEILEAAGYELLFADSILNACHCIERPGAHLVVAAQMMHMKTGLDFLKTLRRFPGSANIPFILMSGHRSSVLREASRIGGGKFLCTNSRGWTGDLLTLVNECLSHSQARKES